MNVVFMGTPDFAVPSLKALLDAGHRVLAVYSQPDKPKGRGHKLLQTPVKEFAFTQNLPVYQPVSLKDIQVETQLKDLAPDCIVVVAYGKILPKAVLDIPKLGCINVHGSLLPQYRGAAPIQWAVLNGDTVTGVTTMLMVEGLVDTGDILLQAQTPIDSMETSGQLFNRLKMLGAALLVETLATLPSIIPQKQDNTVASRAPMISKEQSAVDWTSAAIAIHNQIRGLNPWPCANTTIDGNRLKLYSTRVLAENGMPGKAFVKDNMLCVYCGQGALALLELQPENGKRMTSESYLLGHPLKG